MSRCGVCELDQNVVLGDGPDSCDLVFIGEKPGREEANRKYPFCGEAGREFNQHYLSLAGLEREGIYITNCVKCRLGGNNDKPTPTQVKVCAGHWLKKEVIKRGPKVVVVMGATACSILGEGRVDLDKDHGLPMWFEGSELLPWEGWVWPMYHPALGMHDTGKITQLRQDFKRLGEWRRGKYKHPQDDGVRDYRLLTTVKEIDQDMADEQYDYLPTDLEDDSKGRVWSIQWSVRPGHGRMILVEDRRLVEAWALNARWGRQGLALHNAPGDLDRLDEIGAGEFKHIDTMQEAYQLCDLPQGLKSLGWRLFGVRMRDYVDVVEGWSKRAMVEWLMRVWMYESERPEIKITPYKKPIKRNGVLVSEKREEKPNEQARRAKWVMEHCESPTYDPWEKVVEFKLAGRYDFLEGIGEHPGKGLELVPIDEAVRYGCEDADLTGRLMGWLEEERERRVGEGGSWEIAEEDYDACRAE